jgi:hypothetical protein
MFLVMFSCPLQSTNQITWSLRALLNQTVTKMLQDGRYFSGCPTLSTNETTQWQDLIFCQQSNLGYLKFFSKGKGHSKPQSHKASATPRYPIARAMRNPHLHTLSRGIAYALPVAVQYSCIRPFGQRDPSLFASSLFVFVCPVCFLVFCFACVTIVQLLLPVLATELSLLSRGRMTLEVREIFWFISHTPPQCHTLQGVRDTYL